MPSSPTRGIDHVGITVPDLEAASRFLVEAFGAEVAYTNHTKSDPPETGAEAEARLGFVAGSAIVAVQTLRSAWAVSRNKSRPGTVRRPAPHRTFGTWPYLSMGRPGAPCRRSLGAGT